MAVVEFTGEADFEASRKAEAWCAARGLSVGPMDRYKRRGILLGDYLIAKWHNLTHAEIEQLDGVMSGDGRSGPVYVNLKSKLFDSLGGGAA